ncbi:MAG: hypothetical protein AAGC96_06910 [Pseudomonadota bacterium]
MGRKFILAGSVALTLALGSLAHAVEMSDIVPAFDDELETYKKVGEWTVLANKTRGDCLIERSDDLGNAMQMGLVKGGSAVYLGVFTKQPADIEPNTPIQIAVDGQVYAGEAYGAKSGTLEGDYKGGYVLSQDPEFVNAIAQGRELVAFPEKKGVFIVDLTGTKRAIDEARACLQAQS